MFVCLRCYFSSVYAIANTSEANVPIGYKQRTADVFFSGVWYDKHSLEHSPTVS